MELLFRGSLIYLEEIEYVFRERFQMYFIFLMAFPKDGAFLPFYLTSKISKMSVVTFQKFIVRQMTPSFIYRLTHAE